MPDKKNLFSTSLLGSAIVAAISGTAIAAELADRGAAYQLVEVAELADSELLGLTPTALSADGNWVAGYGARFLMPFRFDETLRYVWNTGCTFADEVCKLDWEGLDGKANGFRYYREARLDAPTNGYDASLLAFALDSSTQTSTDSAIAIGDSDKLTVFDIALATDSTDVMPTAFSDDGSLMAGNETGPYQLSEGVWEREYVRRGFVTDIHQNGALICELLPDLSNLPESNRGGLSAVYGLAENVDFGNGEQRTIAVGLRDNGRPDGDWDAFDDCEFGTNDDDNDCPGFNTQAALWDVTDCVNSASGGDVEGTSLASAYLSADSGDYPIANAHAINHSGIAVGASAYAIDDAARGVAAVFSVARNTNDGSYSATAPVAIPMTSSNGTRGPSDDFFDQIQNAWAVDINDQNQVVGNVYYASPKNRSKAYEFFVYDYDDHQDSTILAEFPLRDKPVIGANSFANAINSDGLVVGWRDADGDISPTFNGTTRDKEAFLFDSRNSSTFNLNDLICSVEGGAVNRPLYRLLNAVGISDDGQILAKAGRFETQADWSKRVNGTSILVKLAPDPAYVTDDAGQLSIDAVTCPEVESASFERSAGAMSYWLLGILALLGVRRVTKLKNT